jgi:hypothetical protein
MSEPAPAAAPAAIDNAVEQAIAVCGGDAVAALRAALIANAFLEAEVERLTAAVSSGFTRGKVTKPPKEKEAR